MSPAQEKSGIWVKFIKSIPNPINMVLWITILGLVAASLTTISFLPQAIKTIRTKQTRDISLLMYTVITIGILLWLIYGAFIGDLPLIAANTITFIFAAVVLMYKIKYK